MPIKKITDKSGLFNLGQIRRLSRMAERNQTPDFDLIIELSFDKFWGEAFVDGKWSYHKTKNGRRKYPKLIVLHLVPNVGIKRFPHSWESKGAYIGYTVRTEEEAILYLLSHEVRHLQQHRSHNIRKPDGCRGRYSERDADLYAIKIIREYRLAKRKQRIIFKE